MIKLLAIDDHQDNLTTLMAVLHDAMPECALVTALNGPRGLALAASEDPDVILLDIVMPGMDGFEVCRRLKADPRLSMIPVVFLTALRTDRESRVKALEFGAEAFLAKPLEELELVAQIRAMAKIKAANRRQRLEKEQLATLVAERTRELEAALAERQQTEDQLRRNEARLRSLATVLQYRGRTTQDFLDFALTEAIKLTSSQFGYLYFYYEDRQQFVLNSWSKEVMPACAIANPQTCYDLSQTGIWGEAVRQRRPILLNDFQAAQPLKKGYPEGHAPLHNYLTIPVFSRDQIVAVVAVANKEHDYDDADIQQLQLLMEAVWKVAEQRQAAEALRESEERFKSAFTHSAIGMAIVSPEGQWMKVNPRLCAMVGYSEAQLLAKTVQDITHPDDLASDLAYVRQLLAGEIENYMMEKRYYHERGNVIWVQLAVALVRGGAGVPLYFISQIEDITARKQAEQERQRLLAQVQAYASELRDTNEQLSHLLGSLPIVIYTSKVGGDFGALFVSANITAVTGYAPQDFIRHPPFWVDRVHPDDAPRISAEMPRLFERGVHEHEYRWRVADGSYKWFADSLRLIVTAEGKPSHILGVWQDITARKQTEVTVRESLREKETLLKEIHHRVKNNLQVIISLLRMQSRQIKNQEALAVLEEMKNRVYSMALIHETLYGSENLARIDLDRYIKQLCSHLFQALVSRSGTLRFEYELAPVELAIDQAVPCGLLINELVSNSLKHAFPEGHPGGEVRIELGPVAGGPAVRLQVSDSGVGLPPGFDVERAASLGLPLVSGLARQLGGRLEIGPGPGARFSVTFTPEPHL